MSSSPADIPATSASSTPSTPRRISPGIFAPLPTFFLPGSQDLDIPTFTKHALKIAHAGVGLLVAGSMGEAHHLAPEERVELIKALRTALDTATPSLAHVPIIAGTGAGSTRQTIQLTKDAYDAGADYAIVIASGFFAGALKDDRAALKGFWSDVASTSPLPIFIYNYPGASGGIDLESDLIEDLAAEHANIIGVKLTCGNVGKLTRIAATTTDPKWIKDHPRSIDTPFLVLGGFTDFVVPSVYAGAHGAITGLANVAPHAIASLFNTATASSPTSPPSLSPSTFTPLELLKDAQRLQGIVARADRTIALAGVPGTKWLLQHLDTETFPVSAAEPRRPLSRTKDEAGERLLKHPNVVELLEEEEAARLAATANTAAPVLAPVEIAEVPPPIALPLSTEIVLDDAAAEPTSTGSEEGTVVEEDAVVDESENHVKEESVVDPEAQSPTSIVEHVKSVIDDVVHPTAVTA